MPERVDWHRIRSDFPAVEKFRYFSTASGGPMARPVYERSIEYYRDLLENGDANWRQNLAQREEARLKVADFINADPEEVEFITSTGYGMNLLAGMLSDEGDVIASPLEFPSTTIPWLHRRPDSVRWVKPLEDGTVPAGLYLAAMGRKTRIIATSYVQFSNGFRQDLRELGERKGNHLLIVNATQAAGAFRIDVKEMKIDALCCNSYKWLLSGYGCGFIYVSRELLSRTLPPLIGWFGVENREEHRNDYFRPLPTAERFNLGAPPFPPILALGAGIEYLQAIGQDSIEQRVLELNRYLTRRLAEIGVEVLSPLTPEKYRSAQTLVRLAEPRKTVERLEQKRILCTPKPQGIRVATHFYVSHEDIDQLIGALQEEL